MPKLYFVPLIEIRRSAGSCKVEEGLLFLLLHQMYIHEGGSHCHASQVCASLFIVTVAGDQGQCWFIGMRKDTRVVRLDQGIGDDFIGITIIPNENINVFMYSKSLQVIEGTWFAIRRNHMGGNDTVS